jgi:hypothetical protein
MEDTKALDKIIEHAKVYNQAYTTYQIITRERCKSVLLDSKFRTRYGLTDKADLLPSLLQYFYEMGKEDAIEELKEKL